MRILAQIVAVVVLFLAQASHAAGVALITDLSGKVEAEDGGAAPGVLSELDSGVKLRLAAGARTTLLYLASGEEYQLKGAGRYQIGATAPAALQGAQPEKRKLPVDSLPGVRVKPSSVAQATLVMRSIVRTSLPKLIGPVSTKILEERPVFAWESVAGAEIYHLQVTDGSGQIVAELETRETTARLPEGLRLKDGQAYSWSVETRIGSGRKYSSWGEFAVLEADKRVRLEQIRPGPKARFSDRVVFALLLDQFDLRQAAQEEWRKLAAERESETGLRRQAGLE